VNADYENVDGVFSFSDELANERTEVLGDASGVLRGNREIEGSIPLAQHTPQSSSVTMMSGSPLGLRGATEEVAEEKRQPIAFVRAVSPAAPWWRGWSSGILHRLWQTPALAEQHSDSRYTITADATNSANGPAAKVPIGRQNRYRDVKVVVVSDERGNGADPGGSLDAYSKLQGAGLAEKVDILVVHPEAYSSARGPFHEGDVTRYTHIMDVNMQGTVNMVKSLVPHMLRRKGARLAIVSSVAGSALAPERAVFGASKAFLHAFAASLRREYLTDGLLVTLAIPGPLRGQDAGAPMTTGNIMTQPQRRISLEGLDIDEDCIIHKAWGM
jgi:NAD(P)-dependent dehydrogenase (short-subunit alcohol dehydrogenase family)